MTARDDYPWLAAREPATTAALDEIDALRWLSYHATSTPDEVNEADCNCGWGGTHDPDNPACRRNVPFVPDEANEQGTT